MSEREFLGIWIPAEVWLDDRLTITEKAFLAEVESFSKNGKTFHKSNDTIRQQYGITPKTVQRIIKKLVQLELLECYFNCLLYTSPSPRDGLLSRMPSSA